MIIDVSYAQGKIDWAKVAKDKNVEGVIIQVGYGQNRMTRSSKTMLMAVLSMAFHSGCTYTHTLKQWQRLRVKQST